MLFDLEILLVYPYAVSAYNNEIYGLWVVLIFLAVLTAGFVFEIGRGALKINSRQRANLNNSKLAAMSNLNASESKSHSSLSHSEKHVSFSRQHVSSFKRAYSTNSRTPTLSSRAKLHPWFVTGLPTPKDGSELELKNVKIKKLDGPFRVEPRFQLVSHERDRALSFFLFTTLFLFFLVIASLTKKTVKESSKKLKRCEAAPFLAPQVFNINNIYIYNYLYSKLFFF